MFKKLAFLSLVILSNSLFAQENIENEYQSSIDKFKTLVNHNMNVSLNIYNVSEKIIENENGDSEVFAYIIKNNKEEKTTIEEIISGAYVEYSITDNKLNCNLTILNHPLSGINNYKQKNIPTDFLIFHELSHCYQKELYLNKNADFIYKGLQSETWADSFALLLLQDEQIKESLIKARKTKKQNIHSTSDFISEIDLKNNNFINEATRIANKTLRN